MDWIKRNLKFVGGSVVALVLMGLAGYYLYSGMAKNHASLEKLNAEYATLQSLNSKRPHPGDETVNNIKAAKEQEAQARTFIGKTAKVFEPIAPIPDSTNLNNALLAAAMRRTIDQMRKVASGSGVDIGTNYCFSFKAEENLIQFDHAGLVPLAKQLGEVKAICDVLFAARVNAIDNIRRERVSLEDRNAVQSTDYHDMVTRTNDVALVSSYEVSVRCFSGEIASFLARYANSPHGLIVQAINVEPAVATGLAGAGMMQPGGPIRNPYEEEPVARYGVPARPAYTPYAPAYAPPPSRGGLQTLLDEKQLKVVMLIEVVKLIPGK